MATRSGGVPGRTASVYSARNGADGIAMLVFAATLGFYGPVAARADSVARSSYSR